MRSNHGKRPSEMSRRKKKLNKKGTLGWIVSIIQLILSALCVFVIYKIDVIPEEYLIIIAVLLAILVVIFRLMMGKGKKKVRFYIGLFFAVIISVVLFFGNMVLFQVNDTLQDITEVEHEVTGMNVYVLKDDPAQTMSDVVDYEFGILKTQGRKDTNNAIVQINEELETDIAVGEYDDALLLAQALYDQECEAVILSESFVEMVSESEGYETFQEDIRMIGTYEWKTIITSNTVEEAEPEEENVFTVYISGIDTSGSISKKSRSDVNIIAVFNRDTHQVQLISTPRDYYVPLSISDGVKDKLTHAGIYGVDVSMETLEMLYDTDIDYYFRVNFSGFKKLIDSLGGVTVYSDYDFTVGNYHYNKGENYLNGDEALIFARERYSFASGDRQRGKNQMAVITGVIEKMQTPAILQDFTGLMEGISGSFESNIPYDLLTDLVKDQLSGGAAWNVSSYSVDGSGKNASTFSLSTPNYVMEPDMSTVEQAKDLIESVKNGEIPQ